nr:DgaE family pyridoxal phosphate-dependent ammonia lyase [Lentibacillus saliphilus]
MNATRHMNLKKVINASGRMSILGVSTLSDDVLEAMAYGGKHYFEMKDLHEEAGQLVAQYMNTEAAMITNSASSAIALAVAGMITRDDASVERLFEKRHERPGDILIMTGHLIDYGAPVEVMIQLGGGTVKTVGYANGCTLEQIEQAVDDNTRAMLFVQSHHCVQKNMPSLKAVGKLMKELNIPFIVDAAAESDLSSYASDADLLIYSGSKAIEGPTSGILAGRKTYVDFAKQHNRGIGRAMKVGKESIFGLLKALEVYAAFDANDDQEKQLAIIEALQCLNDVPGIKVALHEDEAGRAINRARVSIDQHRAPHDAAHVIHALKEGNVAVYTRDYNVNNGFFDIDPRSLDIADAQYICDKIKQIMGVS